MQSSKEPDKLESNFKLLGSSAAGGTIILVLLFLCFFIAFEKDEKNQTWFFDKIGLTLNLSTLVLGITLGWLAGFIVTPYTKQEEKQFLTYSKAISVFVSGYLVAKINDVVERMLSPDHLFQTIVVFRGMVFVSAFIVALLITFIYRKYVGEPHEQLLVESNEEKPNGLTRKSLEVVRHEHVSTAVTSETQETAEPTKS
jgi:D-alanyl-lipoteichoic acid acyltransferase DltB (MBOAT superfamily)